MTLKKVLKKTILAVIIIATLFLLLEIILKQIYPMKYEKIVEDCATQYDIDKMIIYSIIKEESNFKEEAVSNRGAIGLMQVMENTGNDIANSLNCENFESDELYEPEINIKFGVKYFSELLKKYNNNHLLALAAYNAGMGNVEKWIEEGTIKIDGTDIENIPFKETNMYVRKILRDLEIYKKLY